MTALNLTEALVTEADVFCERDTSYGKETS